MHTNAKPSQYRLLVSDFKLPIFPPMKLANFHLACAVSTRITALMLWQEKFKREFKNKFQKSICHEGRYSMEPQSSDMENGSEELRSRFSLQRSLRSKFLG